MKLLCFAASLRAEESLNLKLVKTASAMIADADASVEIQLADYAKICPPIYDDQPHSEDTMPQQAREFVALLRSSDAVIMAVPEYNWSIPGSFKNLLDWISLIRPSPLQGKPIWLLSASPSRRGGLTGLTQTQLPLQALGGIVFSEYFFLSEAHRVFDDLGTVKEPFLRDELSEKAKNFIKFVMKAKI